MLVLREEGPASFRLPQEPGGSRRRTTEGFEEGRQQRKRQQETKDCRSKETRAFEAGDELAETGCIEMASIDLNALEIGAVQWPEKDRKLRIGIDSRAAVTVFPKTGGGGLPDAPNARQTKKSYRPASGKLLPDVGARAVQVKLIDGSLRYVNPRVADTHRAFDGGVRGERCETRCVLHQERQRHQGVRAPRGQWHEAGAREDDWSFQICQSNLVRTARELLRTALQVSILHFLLWNRSKK